MMHLSSLDRAGKALGWVDDHQGVYLVKNKGQHAYISYHVMYSLMRVPVELIPGILYEGAPVPGMKFELYQLECYVRPLLLWVLGEHEGP